MNADPRVTGGWAVDQLTSYLSGLAHAGNPAAVVREAIDRAAEALEAEVAALIVDGVVVGTIGFAQGAVPTEALLELIDAKPASTDLAGLGRCQVLVTSFESVQRGALLVARTGHDGFSLDERNLLRGMGRALSLNLQTTRTLAAMQERQSLMERLARIQASINSRAPLPDVLQNIVAGAAELIGEDFAVLRTIDPEDPSTAVVVCSVGVDDGSVLGSRVPLGRGVGGQSIAENRLVVVHDYAAWQDRLPGYAELTVQAAMAAPVHENGEVVGSLLVSSSHPGRRYSTVEQEMLLSFAGHASLAITDATTTQSLRRALDDARHDALHDELTGLPNRALLRDRLHLAWSRAYRTKTPIALLFIDFDNFKDINDSLGHDAGDQLLLALAKRLAGVLRPGDTIARLGGDEFAVLIEQLEHPRAAEAVARRLLAALTESVRLNGREVTISGSIGIAISDFEEADSRSLLYAADLAMYEAKRGGGGRFVSYQPAMHHQTMERLDTEQALKRAIAADELVLHYQPIHDLRSGRIVAVEALVRWQHPTRGLIGPLEFVPVAESSRLIGALGEWVLRHACAAAAGWPPGIEIAVNLSPKQIEPGFPELVSEVLTQTRLRSDRLTLEVTEGTAMTDAPETLQIIDDLHDMGVRLAIDDFGTGYSSLARLTRLPFDHLKIDRSFVDALDTDAANDALIGAIVALCRGTDLVAVAEGVETQEQLNRLVRLGCDRAQGYFLGRPVDAASIAASLDQAMVKALLGTA